MFSIAAARKVPVRQVDVPVSLQASVVQTCVDVAIVQIKRKLRTRRMTTVLTQTVRTELSYVASSVAVVALKSSPYIVLCSFSFCIYCTYLIVCV